ncbi:hypothetical protein [Gemmatirosa kalamazoonensis]|uniref:hypothetical protein n=1 Tax=Gemmatirosa kalamazoonensis TaxID=861299 RepID=UPI0011DCD74D|nr:hypothetical protein [Gemmatirosa kalamazoonensis]
MLTSAPASPARGTESTRPSVPCGVMSCMVSDDGSTNSVESPRNGRRLPRCPAYAFPVALDVSATTVERARSGSSSSTRRRATSFRSTRPSASSRTLMSDPNDSAAVRSTGPNGRGACGFCAAAGIASSAAAAWAEMRFIVSVARVAVVLTSAR